MTNDDAIEIVKTFRETMDSPITNYRDILLGALDMAIDALREQRPQGEWKLADKVNLAFIYKCSACGRRVTIYTDSELTNMYPFCHCGANMKGGAE